MSQPIVTVHIMGGLGNQLFQLAAAYAYAKKEGGKLCIRHITENGDRPVYWDTLLHRIQPYLVASLPHLPIWQESLPTMYQEIGPLFPSGLQLHGYLQTSKYWKERKEEIHALFSADDTLVSSLSPTYQYLLDNKDRVVVVHARRTDYLKTPGHVQFHGPLTGDYYRRAISRIQVTNPIWVLTSDDNRFWTEIESDLVGIHTPILLMESSDIRAFALLQQFQHFILSNSTFIWWCAWLSGATDVIVPSQWFGPTGPHPFDDIYEDHWVKI